MAERRAAVCLKTANRTDPRSKYPQPTRNHSQYDNHYESFGSIIPRPRRQPPLQAKYKPKSDRLLENSTPLTGSHSEDRFML